MMASTHTYDLPGAVPPGASNKRMDPGAVEMALNPDEVDLIDSEALQVKLNTHDSFFFFMNFQ